MDEHRCHSRIRAGNRRALTLIELLVTLALFVAFMAISYPAVYARFADRQLEESAERTRSLLTLARVEAQSTGKPIEVVYLPADREIVYRRWTGDDSESGLDSFGSMAGATFVESDFGGSSSSSGRDRDQIIGFDGGSASRASDFDLGGIGDSDSVSQRDDSASAAAGSDQSNQWSVVKLPDEVFLDTKMSVQLSDDSQAESFGAAFGQSDSAKSDNESIDVNTVANRDSDGIEFLAAAPTEPTLLVVFLPDGSALVDASFILRVRDGDRRRIRVNAWTGRVSIDEGNESDDSAVQPDSADETDLGASDDASMHDFESPGSVTSRENSVESSGNRR